MGRFANLSSKSSGNVTVKAIQSENALNPVLVLRASLNFLEIGLMRCHKSPGSL